MKLSNFKLERTEGNGPLDLVYHASVDVESGFLFVKTKERRRIIRKFAGFWYFVDNGEWVPDKITALARSWTARTGEEC